MAQVKTIGKLKDNKGASLIMALLMFLVCAVIGAVVLTAGTATAGRVSSLSEMDQRYYSVTSAAEFFASELGGKTVTVVRERQYTEQTTKTYTVSIDEEGNEISSLTGTDTVRKATYTTTVNGASFGADITVTTDGSTVPASNVGSAVDLSAASFLTARALDLLFGASNCNTDAAMALSFASGSASGPFPFTLEHTSSAVDAEALAVKGTYSVKSDGTIVIRISDNADSDNYVLNLTLCPVFSETDNTTGNGAGTVTVTPNETGFTEETVKTSALTKTSSVTWTVGSITKEVSSPDEEP